MAPSVSRVPRGTSGVSLGSFRLYLQARYQERVARLFFRRPFDIRMQSSLISFTFDDFPQSSLLVGGCILQRCGLMGTYYVSLGLMGTVAPTGRIATPGDLRSAYGRGHELGCHTFSHCDPLKTDSRHYEAAVIENRLALSRVIPGATFKTFAYPTGSPRLLAKAKVAQHFLCCRAGGQAINVDSIDLNHLSAYFLEKSRHDIQAVKDIIDQNSKQHGWLIFATHDVAENPTRYGCTPEFFEEVVRYAVRSRARILPVASALDVLRTWSSQSQPE